MTKSMKIFSVVLFFWRTHMIEIKGKYAQYWFSIIFFHPRLKWDDIVANNNTRNEFREKMLSDIILQPLKQEKGPLMIDCFLYGWVKQALVGAATQWNTRTKKQFSHLWKLVSNDVNNDYEELAIVTIPHSADDAYVCCHFIKRMVIFAEFIYHNNFWNFWSGQRTVRIGLTVLLVLTSIFSQWFSPKSHSYINYN